MQTEVNNLKNYFGNRLKIYTEEELGNSVVRKLTSTNREILIDVGIPKYNGVGGTYEPIQNTSIINNRYLTIYSNGLPWSNVSIDLKTNIVVYLNDIDDPQYNHSKCNKNLHTHLEYIMIFEKFYKNMVFTEALGPYDDDKNYVRYAKALENNFKKINDDYKKGMWSILLLEMNLGTI